MNISKEIRKKIKIIRIFQYSFPLPEKVIGCFVCSLMNMKNTRDDDTGRDRSTDCEYVVEKRIEQSYRRA